MLIGGGKDQAVWLFFIFVFIETIRLVSGDSTPEIVDLLEQASIKLGVPILFPLMDLEDQQKISFTDIWGGFSGAIHDASERYATEALLVGRILQARNGLWSARWNLYDTQGELQWQ